MPSRPPHVCSGCGAAVTGRCTTCHPPTAWARKPTSWAAGSSRRWRRFRAAWLADHPWCVGPGCEQLADQVDHVTPLHQFQPGPDRESARFDSANVQSLCTACHARKTAQEGAEVSRIRRAQDTTGQLW